MDNRDAIIKDAQYRKGLSISYFNSLNAAVELAKTIPVGTPEEYVMDRIRKWRDLFLEEHKTYYATVIAKVGLAYSPSEAIATLQAQTTLEGLSNAWILLSEDERHDETVVAAVQELKKRFVVPEAVPDIKPTKNEKKK